MKTVTPALIVAPVEMYFNEKTLVKVCESGKGRYEPTAG
jgi:hypothetical protein